MKDRSCETKPISGGPGRRPRRDRTKQSQLTRRDRKAEQLVFPLFSAFFVSFGYGGFSSGPRSGHLGDDDSCETKPIGTGVSGLTFEVSREQSVAASSEPLPAWGRDCRTKQSHFGQARLVPGGRRCRTNPIPGGRNTPIVPLFHHSSIPIRCLPCETKPIPGTRRPWRDRAPATWAFELHTSRRNALRRHYEHGCAVPNKANWRAGTLALLGAVVRNKANSAVSACQ